eukprot:746552-Hanusia_phi.AAC.5
MAGVPPGMNRRMREEERRRGGEEEERASEQKEKGEGRRRSRGAGVRTRRVRRMEEDLLVQTSCSRRPILKRPTTEETNEVGKRKKRDDQGGEQKLPVLNTLRRKHMSVGVVGRASGSAYLESGRTKVVCAVHGPKTDVRSSLFSEHGRVSCFVSISGLSGWDGDRREEEERATELGILPALQSAINLSRYPKSVIEIHVSVVEEDGERLSACIACASLALAHAGIEKFDMVSSCSLALRRGKGIVLEPSTGLSCHDGTLSLSYMHNRKEVTQLVQEGQWKQEEVAEAMRVGLRACRSLYALMRIALMKHQEEEEEEEEV